MSAGSARAPAHSGEMENQLSGTAPRPAASILFEDDRAPSRWEPFEPEPKPLAAFAQIYLASASVAPDEGEESSAEGEPGDAASPGRFAAAEMVWRAQNDAAEDLKHSHAQGIQEIEARHQQELDELQRRLTQNLSQSFADAVNTLEMRIAAELNTRLSSLLAPFLSEHAKRASAAAIVEELLSLILSGKLSPIKLSGPAPMISEVRQAMGSAGDRIVFADVQSPELVIEIDAHIISTRIAEWSDCLQAALS
jgi:hypothetical protein